MEKLDQNKTIYLIDGTSFLYRAYYAMRPLHTLKGEPVQAVYGFVRMIKKLINTFNPQYMALVWDAPGKTTRHEAYEAYKATRQAPPSDLFEQKKYIRQFADLIGLEQIEIDGIEADDIMYAVGQDMKKKGFDTVLITSDKDMGQMLDEHTYIYDTFKDTLFDVKAFEQKMGFPVHKLPFYFALLGDASDNIPGVRGIGKKGALELVNQFDSIEHMYDNLDAVKKPRMRTALEQNKNNAFLSRDLFLLQYHPVKVTQKDMQFDPAHWAKARPLFQELNFKSLLKDMVEGNDPQSKSEQTSKKKRLNYPFKKVTTEAALSELLDALRTKKAFALDTETTGLRPHKDELVGISFATEKGKAWYIPVAHKVEEKQLPKQTVIQALKPILEDVTYKKYLHNASFDKVVLWHAGIDLNGIHFDSLLAAKLTNKAWQRANLKELSQYYFDEAMLTYQEVVKDNKYRNFSYVPLDLATQYAAADAHQTLRLYDTLQEMLKKEEQKELYETIEHPLQQVLFTMEQAGIYLDKDILAELGNKVTQELIEIEDEIIKLAGPAYAGINLNSPKQVEQLLFYDLKLPPQKKSSKGSYSTDHQVLKSLSKLHPIPMLIAKYRELAKLKSTYIDVLPTYINAGTGKIHTSFNQTAVATGRLSSSDPNLQNIPADADGYGIEVRASFKPEEGHLFISADYSQIELRVMAYLSQDKSLMQAFMQGADIHTQTASRLFDVQPAQVTQQQRQIGKRINFSILYGMTPYGLSKDLDIPFKEAKQYIQTYFEQYTGVGHWIDHVIEQTKEKGFVSTIWGRRRYIPAIYESNRSLYQEAVRVAVNTRVQGTAAEIMKIGMIRLNQALKEQGIDANILLQIHDELLMSVKQGLEAQVEQITRQVLENVVDWNVPLKVTTRVGANWKEVTK